jgi:hypothetical protein
LPNKRSQPGFIAEPGHDRDGMDDVSHKRQKITHAMDAVYLLTPQQYADMSDVHHIPQESNAPPGIQPDAGSTVETFDSKQQVSIPDIAPSDNTGMSAAPVTEIPVEGSEGIESHVL